MGKYTKLRSKLKKYEHEKSYQSKIDAAKHDILSADNPEDASAAYYARMLADLKEKKRGLEAQLASNNVLIEACSQVLVTLLTDEEQQRIELASGGSVGLRDDVYASVADMRKLFAHLVETNQISWLKIGLSDEMFASAKAKRAFLQRIQDENLFDRLSANQQTLKMFAGEYLLADKPAPPGVKVTLKTSAQVYGMNGDSNDD